MNHLFKWYFILDLPACFITIFVFDFKVKNKATLTTHSWKQTPFIVEQKYLFSKIGIGMTWKINFVDPFK